MRIGIDTGHGTLRQVNGSWVKDIGTAAGSLGEYEANMKIALELYPMLRAGGHDSNALRYSLDKTNCTCLLFQSVHMAYFIPLSSILL